MKDARCSEDATVKDARGVRGPGEHRTEAERPICARLLGSDRQVHLQLMSVSAGEEAGFPCRMFPPAGSLCSADAGGSENSARVF